MGADSPWPANLSSRLSANATPATIEANDYANPGLVDRATNAGNTYASQMGSDLSPQEQSMAREGKVAAAQQLLERENKSDQTPTVIPSTWWKGENPNPNAWHRPEDVGKTTVAQASPMDDYDTSGGITKPRGVDMNTLVPPSINDVALPAARTMNQEALDNFNALMASAAEKTRQGKIAVQQLQNEGKIPPAQIRGAATIEGHRLSAAPGHGRNRLAQQKMDEDSRQLDVFAKTNNLYLKNPDGSLAQDEDGNPITDRWAAKNAGILTSKPVPGGARGPGTGKISDVDKQTIDKNMQRIINITTTTRGMPDETQIREINSLKQEIKDVRAKYTTGAPSPWILGGGAAQPTNEPQAAPDDFDSFITGNQ